MDQIFSATYSGVDVFEFLHPNGSIMRRKNDGWVNATHILKTANFPKAKRTRILERDVQIGQHEKVQGGYGKYQGTWVPLSRAIEVAKEFDVYDVLRPLFDWDSSNASPPPAPKHHHVSKTNSIVEKPHSQRKAAPARKTASLPVKVTKPISTSSQEKKKRGRPRALNAPPYSSNPNEGTFVGRRLNSDILPNPQVLRSSPVDDTIIEQHSLGYINDEKLDIEDGLSSDIEDGRFIGSSSPSEFMSDTDLANALKTPDHRTNQNAREGLERAIHIHTENHRNMQHHVNWYDTNAKYTSKLLEYFMSSDDEAANDVPSFILNPPKELNLDEIIDDEGHTLFHWACSMGNSQVAQSWINLGANYRAVNNLGETALMRSVMFTNAYTRKTFPALVELLSETIFEFDSTHRTVLHHIASAATTKSRFSAAVYYMDILLAKISESQSPERLEVFLNLQDNNGDNALHISARNGNRKCIKLLLEYKANHNLKNNRGLTASVLLLENENIAPKVHQRYETHLKNQYASFIPPVAEPHISEAAIDATHKVSNFFIESLNELSYAYDNELQRKESDVIEVKELLSNMNNEIRLTKLKTKEYIGQDLNEEQLQGKIRSLEVQVERSRDLLHTKESKLKRIIERSQLRELNILSKNIIEEENHTTTQDDPKALTMELTKLQIQRKKFIDQIVEFHGGLNESNGKMQKYKKLISVCSDVEIDQVFDKVDELLSEIEKSV